MFIAHIPAGYIFARALVKRKDDVRAFLLAGAAGGAAPDFDVIWFLWGDDRQHHHHSYWSHYPIVWGCLILVSAIWFRYSGRGRVAELSLFFSGAGLLHLILDSVAGDIRWLEPFRDTPFSLVTIPALYDPWWLNFLLHWSSALELIIVLYACWLWIRDRIYAEPTTTVKGRLRTLTGNTN